MARSSITQLRRAMWRGSTILGDVQAVRTGRVPQRVTNRIIGRAAGRVLRGLWR
jgi:hypothetical protein